MDRHRTEARRETFRSVLMGVIWLFLAVGHVAAQTPPKTEEQKVDELIQLLQDPGTRARLESQTVQDVPSTSATPTTNTWLSTWESRTRDRIGEVVSSVPNIPSALAAIYLKLDDDLQPRSRVPAAVILAAFLALSMTAERAFRRYGTNKRETPGLLLPAVVSAGSIIVAFFAVPWPPLTRLILLAYLPGIIAFRLGLVFIELSFSPPKLKTRAMVILALATLAVSTSSLTQQLEMPPATSRALSSMFSIVISGLAVEATWSSTGRNTAARAALTSMLLLTWLVWCLDFKGLFWLGLYALFLPGVISSVGRLVEASWSGAIDGPRKTLIIRGARAIVIGAAAAWLAVVWQLNPDSLGHRNPVVTAIFYGLVKSVIVLLVADLIWHLAKDWIDRSIGRSQQDEGLSAEEAARHGRLRTLLPIFRNVLGVSVLVMAGLAVLAELGVEIGPLIAGAGIFGIALGFGSQTLVKDIISGVFYMLDDAFRVGEYIQSKDYKGTVEGFSLRSVRLRHHRGPVFTIPFGEMGAVQNMSRDWSVIKFIVSVGYETDVAKVKAITKTIGKELANDAEFHPVIIENLKMKGLEKFGEYGIDLSFGMMLRPSPIQSMIRRRANLMLREAFKENGISFATPSVQVEGDDRSNAAAAVAASRLRQVKAADSEA